MSLSKNAKKEITDLLLTTVTEKLEKYDPETGYMPFHYRLLGKERYAMFSFIQSMNTTFGTSIWEQVAVILAKSNGNYAQRQYELLGQINNKTEKLVSEIHYKLRKGEISADKTKEFELIKKSMTPGKPKKDPDSMVDLFVKIGNTENYFDITSAKPNIKEFVALKLKLLRWTALRLSQGKNAKIVTRLAIPYNPYHPHPYERWTLKGLYDLKNMEIMVGKEFWNFVASDEIYDELLDAFEQAGKKLRDKIDKKFSEFKQIKV